MLIHDKKLIKVFISLIKNNVLKTNFKPKVKKRLSQNWGTKIFWKNPRELVIKLRIKVHVNPGGPEFYMRYKAHHKASQTSLQDENPYYQNS